MMYAELTGNRKRQGIKSPCGNTIDVELGTGVYAGEKSQAKEIPWHFMGSDGKWHTTSGVQARPYLRPAVEDNGEEYKAVLKKALKDEA